MADVNMDCVFWVERFAMLLLVFFFSGFEWCYCSVVFIFCFTNIIYCASYFFFNQQQRQYQIGLTITRETEKGSDSCKELDAEKDKSEYHQKEEKANDTGDEELKESHPRGIGGSSDEEEKKANEESNKESKYETKAAAYHDKEDNFHLQRSLKAKYIDDSKKTRDKYQEDVEKNNQKHVEEQRKWEEEKNELVSKLETATENYEFYKECYHSIRDESEENRHKWEEEITIVAAKLRALQCWVLKAGSPMRFPSFVLDFKNKRLPHIDC